MERPLPDDLEALNSVDWLLTQVNEDDKSEFVLGFMQRLAPIQGKDPGTVPFDQAAPVIRDVVSWARSWYVSTKLAGDPTWKRDMVEAEEALEQGANDPIGVEELHRLLGV